MLSKVLETGYKQVMKPVLFQFDPEFVHNEMTARGELLGKTKITKSLIHSLFYYQDNSLQQKIAGIKFENPIGLAAGFDYEAKLTQILVDVGFGFQTVGTITNLPYEGNPKPRLGRLPKSKSLMVNKGFKNKGADAIIKKLSGLEFGIPVGISIGSEKGSIADITSAFKKFEKTKVENSFYELNISCPNLHGNKSFYPSKNLEQLLLAVDTLKLKKPIFIKMPISESNKAILAMLKVITHHQITGVIFGNLQKDRTNPALDSDEVSKFKKGNFSGKPTFDRSNELISLCYKNYKDKLIIIGCGGVFTAEDAYTKIKMGASLIQMITGMIYEGPQVIGQINEGLVKLLRQDGFKNISQAIGAEHR